MSAMHCSPRNSRPHSSNILHTFARLCVRVQRSTTEWECDETYITYSAYSPIASLLRHHICVDRYTHFPSFGNDISANGRDGECVYTGTRHRFPDSVLFSPFVQLVRRSATQFFSVSNRNQQQFAKK